MATFETRRTKKGKTTIRAKVRVKGYAFQTATFDKLTDAKTWAYGLEADMRKGKHIKYTESSKHTLSELIDKYIKEELPNRNSDQGKFMMHLAWWKSKIGNRYLKDVTPQLISEYKLVLANEPNARATKNLVKKSPATVNRYLATLSIVLSKAYKEWEWIEENPMTKVEKYRESRGRTRFLSREEQKRLIDACDNSSTHLLKLLVVLALATGGRHNEIAGLTWQNVRFNDKEKSVTLYFMNTKNRTDRDVTVSGLPYELLKQHSKVRRIDSNYVFARPDGLKPYDLRTQWENALKEAQIEDFRFHDLRHTTASNLAMNGAGLRDIAEILGHKTMQMVQRYSHLTKKYSTEILADMNNKQFDFSDVSSR